MSRTRRQTERSRAEASCHVLKNVLNANEYSLLKMIHAPTQDTKYSDNKSTWHAMYWKTWLTIHALNLHSKTSTLKDVYTQRRLPSKTYALEDMTRNYINLACSQRIGCTMHRK